MDRVVDEVRHFIPDIPDISDGIAESDALLLWAVEHLLQQRAPAAVTSEITGNNNAILWNADILLCQHSTELIRIFATNHHKPLTRCSPQKFLRKRKEKEINWQIGDLHFIIVTITSTD